jgi:hypothetical protein
VDLVQATSAGEGLHALRDRVPDLILTSPLLSPFDDGVLDEYLRELGSAATHVQTVRIPMLSTGPRKKSAATRLFSLGRKKKQTSSAAPDGCDPKIFADEIAHYLTRSLEERSAAKATADKTAGATPQRECEQTPLDDARSTQGDDAAFALGASAPEEWGAPAPLVEEFRAPIEQAPRWAKPVPVVEETHVPGSILDLRPATPKPRGDGGTPVVHAPVTPVVAEPEPVQYIETEPNTYVMPEPTYGQPEPTYVIPEPTYVRPEPTYVMPEPAQLSSEPFDVAQDKLFDSAQGKAAVAKPEVVNTPAPATGGNSASFEAALAAIRAAWAKPEATATPQTKETTTPAQPASTPARNVRPLGGSGEVDLTNAIDSFEEIGSPNRSTTPGGRRLTEKLKKRQDKPREHTHAADGRDEWGVFDPNQCEFSTLVDKLDEVTDSDEPKPRTTNLR